jgi:hypothetical protein
VAVIILHVHKYGGGGGNVTRKLQAGGLHERHVVATWKLVDTGKPRKTCVEVAGRRTFRIITSSQQSGI